MKAVREKISDKIMHWILKLYLYTENTLGQQTYDLTTRSAL